MLDFLAPLDMPRQALANLGRGLGRAGSGQAGLGDYLGMAPGALGVAAGAMFGLPAGALVGGAAQGLGKLTGLDAFEAPTAGDVVEGLGGDPESLAQTIAAQLATDPLTYMGLAGGGKLASGMLRAAPAAAEAAPGVAMMPKLVTEPRPVPMAPAAPRMPPAPPRLPPAPANVFGTPQYESQVLAGIDADAAAQAAREAARAEPVNPLFQAMQEGRRAGVSPGLGDLVVPGGPSEADLMREFIATIPEGLDRNPIYLKHALDDFVRARAGDLRAAGVDLPDPGALSKELEGLYGIYRDLGQDAIAAGPLAGGPSLMQRADLMAEIARKQAKLAEMTDWASAEAGAAGQAAPAHGIPPAHEELLRRIEDEADLLFQLTGQNLEGARPMIRGLPADDVTRLRDLAGSTIDRTQGLPLDFAGGDRPRLASALAELLGGAQAPERFNTALSAIENVGFPLDRAAIAEAYRGPATRHLHGLLQDLLGHLHEGVPAPHSPYFQSLKEMLPQEVLSNVVGHLHDRARLVSETIPGRGLYDLTQPVAERALQKLLQRAGF